MGNLLYKISQITFILSLSLSLGACASAPSRHKQNVQKAEKRWNDTRGTLLLQAAQRQFDAGDLIQASKTLDDAINYDPGNAKLHLLGARINLERSKLERCLRQLEMAAELDPHLSAVPYYQGLVQQRWQRYEEARTFYIKASELEKDNIAYLLAAAEMDLALHQEDQGLKRLLDRVKYFDQNAGIRIAIAEIYRLKEDFDQAVSYYRQAALLEPDSHAVQEELASTLVNANRHGEAIEVYEQLLTHDMDMDRLDIQYALARCYIKTYQLTKARKLYDQMRQKNPQQIDAWIGLGKIALKQQDIQTALRVGNRLQSLAPERHEGYLIAGLCWHQRDESTRAAKMFGRAAQLAPDSAEPAILQGLSLEQAGKLQAAAQAYAEAIRREPEDPRARKLLTRLSAITP